MTFKIAVIILNYNHPEDTLDCLESVFASTLNDFELDPIVVDNSENFHSYQILKERYPKLTLLKNQENLGYAEGNNVGIRYALKSGAECVLILNNDCVLEKDTILKLFESANHFPDAAIVAPLVCFDNYHTKIDSCGTVMDWLRLQPKSARYKNRDDPSIPSVIDAQIIPGSALFLKKKIFEELGLFNPDFFLIHEDADLCLRSRKRNYRNLVITDAIVFHKGSKTLRTYPSLTIYYSIRNFLFLSKMHNDRKRQFLVYVGLVLFFLKKAVSWNWNSIGRQRFRGLVFGIRDYLLNKKGKCPSKLI